MSYEIDILVISRVSSIWIAGQPPDIPLKNLALLGKYSF